MSTAIYRLFLWMYRCGALLISPFSRKAKLWLSGRKTVFDGLEGFKKTEARPVVWFHCASLGEFEQGRPLIEAIRKRYAGYAILITFFSPSGYTVRKNYNGADFVTYLPVDSPSNAARFVLLVNPALVIWVKYEYWYFYLRQIKQRTVPLLLISGIFRPEQPFFKRWGSFHRSMLDCFTFLFVQNEVSRKLLGGIARDSNAMITGDTRFDRVIEIAASPARNPIVEAFISKYPVIVAGSTWEEDEEELDHFANHHPELRFIIAPHETDEDHLREIEKLFHFATRYSVLSPGSAPQIQGPEAMKTIPNVLIIDNVGMLASLYQYATIAYVGGGFGNDGVHNVLEAAVYGRPVIFGPVYEKFAEAVGLVAAGGAFDIENALELEETFLQLLQKDSRYDAACRSAEEFVRNHAGATATILGYIQEKRLLTS